MRGTTRKSPQNGRAGNEHLLESTNQDPRIDYKRNQKPSKKQKTARISRQKRRSEDFVKLSSQQGSGSLKMAAEEKGLGENSHPTSDPRVHKRNPLEKKKDGGQNFGVRKRKQGVWGGFCVFWAVFGCSKVFGWGVSWKGKPGSKTSIR